MGRLGRFRRSLWRLQVLLRLAGTRRMIGRDRSLREERCRFRLLTKMMQFIQPSGDLHERFVQGLECTVGALLGVARVIFELLQVVGQRGERRDIGRSCLAPGGEAMGNIGHNSLGGLAGGSMMYSSLVAT